MEFIINAAQSWKAMVPETLQRKQQNCFQYEISSVGLTLVVQHFSGKNNFFLLHIVTECRNVAATAMGLF